MQSFRTAQVVVQSSELCARHVVHIGAQNMRSNMSSVSFVLFSVSIAMRNHWKYPVFGENFWHSDFIWKNNQIAQSRLKDQGEYRKRFPFPKKARLVFIYTKKNSCNKWHKLHNWVGGWKKVIALSVVMGLQRSQLKCPIDCRQCAHIRKTSIPPTSRGVCGHYHNVYCSDQFKIDNIIIILLAVLYICIIIQINRYNNKVKSI